MDLGEYGFRHDPMAWATSANSLDAACVRAQVLQQPEPADSRIIEEEVQQIFSQQQPDGHIGEATAGALWRLLDLGCPTERPEFQRALKAMRDRHVDEDGSLKGSYGLNVACRGGWADTDELKDAVTKTLNEVETLNFWEACPWHGQNLMQILWSGREHQNVMPAVERGLITMRDHLKDGRHWPMYLDPFGWLECTGFIDHAIAEEIVVKMIPMILRAQKPDGSWGGEDHMGYGPGSHTFAVFRALYKWGLMEPLRSKPPLPAEWTSIKTIPAPSGELQTMTWDGNRLWVYDRTRGRAIAISPEDGKVLHSVKLPDNVGGIAWSKGSLLATQVEPEAVFYLDPDTGTVQRKIPAEDQVWTQFSAIAELDDRICIGNVMHSGLHLYSGGSQIGIDHKWLAGGSVVDIACVDGFVWHIDGFSRLLILNDLSEPNRPASLVEWAGAPFGHDTMGLAWDGAHLWALDAANHRISRIQRLPQQQES